MPEGSSRSGAPPVVAYIRIRKLQKGAVEAAFRQADFSLALNERFVEKKSGVPGIGGSFGNSRCAT